MRELPRQRLKKIATIEKETVGSVKRLRDRAEEASDTGPLEDEYRDLRRRETQRLLDVLSDSQKRELGGMLGPMFDTSRLGRVAFKAPDFATTSEWLQSPPLRIADLKGEVIVLHYWTFG